MKLFVSDKKLRGMVYKMVQEAMITNFQSTLKAAHAEQVRYLEKRQAEIDVALFHVQNETFIDGIVERIRRKQL